MLYSIKEIREGVFLRCSMRVDNAKEYCKALLVRFD